MAAKKEFSETGTRTWRSVKAERLSGSALARVARRARAQVEELTLQELRRGLSLTQVDVARTAEMTQIGAVAPREKPRGSPDFDCSGVTYKALRRGARGSPAVFGGRRA